MEESRNLFDRYQARLNPVDKLYGRIFQMLKAGQSRQSNIVKEASGTISVRIGEFSEVLRTLSDSSKELPEAIGARMHEMTEALGRYQAQLAATGKELPEVISNRIKRGKRGAQPLPATDIQYRSGDKRDGLVPHQRGSRSLDDAIRPPRKPV